MTHPLVVTGQIKLITHNTRNIDLPDDPSLPFKLDLVLTLSGVMMDFAASMIWGDEHIVIRAATLDALRAVMQDFGLSPAMPRFRNLTITGPDGEIERVDHTSRG